MLQSKGAIYYFTSTEINAIDPRATSKGIIHFLEETLISYRLLFGQSKPSRHLFKSILRFETALTCNPDPLLRRLRLDEVFVHPTVPQDRKSYITERDSVVLGLRVKRLADELKAAKPNSLVDLLRDRRDTLQYWTF